MDLPVPPPNLRTQWKTDGGNFVLDLPPAGFSMAEFGPIVAMNVIATIIGLSVFVCFLIIVAPRANNLKQIMFAAFTFACFVLPLQILFQGILWPAFRRTRVIAAPAGLRIERRLGFLQRTKNMSAGEIEELALTRVRTTAITARGRKTAIRFGQGLPEAELQWIHDALGKVLAK